MQSFLFSSFRHRVAVCAGVSLFFTLALVAVVVFTSWPDWSKASDYQSRWPDIADRCNSLFAKARAELEATELRNCYGMFWRDSAACVMDNQRIVDGIFAPLRDTGCAIDTQFMENGRPQTRLVMPVPPGDPLTFSVKAKGISWVALLSGFSVGFLVLFSTADAIRRLIAEPHVGWKRLTIVLAVVSGFGTAIVVAFDRGSPLVAPFLLGPMAFLATSFAIIYGRATILWVAAGFAAPSDIEKKGSGDAANRFSQGTVISEAAATPEQFAAIAPPLRVDTVLPCVDSQVLAATFWPRVWARCIDLPMCWVIASLPGAVLPDIGVVVGGLGGVAVDLVVGLALICCAVFAYEWFFVSSIGATPGKMLFGLSVCRNDNQIPTKEDAWRRAWVYLSTGLYFVLFVPVMQILGAIVAWRRRDGLQPWDIEAGTYVRQTAVGNFRYVVAVFLAFAMMSFMVAANRVLKEISREEIHNSVLRK